MRKQYIKPAIAYAGIDEEDLLAGASEYWGGGNAKSNQILPEEEAEQPQPSYPKTRSIWDD